eukprot:365084-Chlamydomonas_euryale.AAC.12
MTASCPPCVRRAASETRTRSRVKLAADPDQSKARTCSRLEQAAGPDHSKARRRLPSHSRWLLKRVVTGQRWESSSVMGGVYVTREPQSEKRKLHARAACSAPDAACSSGDAASLALEQPTHGQSRSKHKNAAINELQLNPTRTLSRRKPKDAATKP